MKRQEMSEMNQAEIIRKKLNEKKAVFGTHVGLGDPIITEIFGQAGYDFIWIDMEHTALGKPEVLGHLLAARSAGTAAIVRVPWNDPVLVKPILDIGADGIVIPFIRSLEEAKLAISSYLYPPKGIRGFGPGRAADYGGYSALEYVEKAESSIFKFLQIEHIDAVNCLEDIVKIDGLDALIVGPMDLSGSLGKLGRTRDPEVLAALDRIADVALTANIPFGFSFGYVEQDIIDWIRRGATIFSIAGDGSYLANGAADNLRDVKKLVLG